MLVERDRVQLQAAIVFVAVSSLSPEKAMATRSSVLAWRTPGMAEPGVSSVAQLCPTLSTP